MNEQNPPVQPVPQQAIPQQPIYPQQPVYMVPQTPKSRVTYIILGLLFGGIGIHNFYAGYSGRGILQLIFCWTFIPAIIALIEVLTVKKDGRGIPFN